MRSSSWLLRAAVLLPACVGLLATEGAARADDACDRAFLDAQRAEKAGKLVAALAAYKTCAAVACGVNMGNVCNKKSLALAEQVPSVVVVAVEGTSVLAKVTVSMDGAPIAADGSAVSADPGVHTFVFVAPDGRTKTVETVVVEGKKTQAVTARFEPPAAVVPGPSPGEGATTSPRPVADASPSGSSGSRTAGIVIAGGGLVLAGVGGILGLVAKGRYDTSNESNCDAASNRCNPAGLAQRDSAVGLGRAATVVTVIGGVVAIGGVVLWIASPSGAAKGAGVRSIGIGPSGLFLSGSF